GVVLVTSRLSAELGGGRSAQILAAAIAGMASLILATGHLLSTTTFGLLAWSVVLLLIVRLLRTRDDRLFVPLGVVAGVGLMDNDLLAFLLVALAVGIVIAGPRSLFRSRWLLVGVVIAAAMWTPYLIWQARNGWPELTVSRS